MVRDVVRLCETGVAQHLVRLFFVGKSPTFTIDRDRALVDSENSGARFAGIITGVDAEGAFDVGRIAEVRSNAPSHEQAIALATGSTAVHGVHHVRCESIEKLEVAREAARGDDHRASGQVMQRSVEFDANSNHGVIVNDQLHRTHA